MKLFLYVNPLDTVADASEHLVRDGAKGITEHRDGQVVAKDFYLVTLLAVDVGHVNHADIHTDVAHIVGLLSIDEAVAAPIAEMAIESVGIANRNGCRGRRSQGRVREVSPRQRASFQP